MISLNKFSNRLHYFFCNQPGAVLVLLVMFIAATTSGLVCALPPSAPQTGRSNELRIVIVHEHVNKTSPATEVEHPLTSAEISESSVSQVATFEQAPGKPPYGSGNLSKVSDIEAQADPNMVIADGEHYRLKDGRIGQIVRSVASNRHFWFLTVYPTNDGGLQTEALYFERENARLTGRLYNEPTMKDIVAEASYKELREYAEQFTPARP